MLTSNTIRLAVFGLFLCVSLANASDCDSKSLSEIHLLPRELMSCDVYNFNLCSDYKECQSRLSESTLAGEKYIKLYFCTLSILGKFAVVPIGIMLAVSFFALGRAASDYLCPNLHSISLFLHLSDNLAGLTLLAIGNGAPDIFATYTAMTHKSGDLALSELTGAALFISTVVVGTIGVVNPFKVPSSSFTRDMVFVVITVLTVMAAELTELSKFKAFLLVSIYFAYIMVSVYLQSKEASELSTIETFNRTRTNYSQGIELLDHYHEIDPETGGSELPLGSHLFHPPTVDDLVKKVRESLNNHFSTFNSGNYGINLVLKNLVKHSRSGNLQLVGQDLIRAYSASGDQSNQPTSDEPREYFQRSTSITELEELITEDDIETEIDPGSRNLKDYIVPNRGPFRNILESLIQPLQDINDYTILDKIGVIVTFPINFAFRISIPVRDGASLHFLEIYDKQQLTRLISEVETSLEDKYIDFEDDKLLIQLQTFISIILCSYVWSSGIIMVLLFISAFVAVSLIQFLYDTTSIRTNVIRPIYYFTAFQGFIASMTWVYIIATEVIRILSFVSHLYNVSEQVLGLTVFALGNSVGDFISNYTIAKMGMPLMAFGACYGGPLLSFSFLGAAGLVLMKKENATTYHFTFTYTILFSLILILINIVVLRVVLPKNEWLLDRKIGLFLISSWVITTCICLYVDQSDFF